jgi:hypothetical protein
MTQDRVLPDRALEPGAPTAYFVRDGDRYVPTGIGQGPWGQTLGGHIVGGFLGWALESAAGDPELQPARLTVDLLRPTAFEPVEIQTSIVRDGRRIRIADATLTQRGTVISRASALFLRRGQEPADKVWSTPVTMPPMPTEPDVMPEDVTMFIQTYGWGTPTSTGMGLAEWRSDSGQKFAWLRETKLLVDGEPLTPFIRAAMAGDVTNPLTHWGTRRLEFINADYTVTLSRLPQGPYIGLASLTHYSHDGVATGNATLFDHLGPIGSSMAVALANPGFRPPVR